MKVIIAGSRSITDLNLVRRAMIDSAFRPTEIVSGQASGVDKLGEQWAVLHDVPVRGFPADWNRHGKRAGPIRNREMAAHADAAVILWDGKSKGTQDMINAMVAAKKPYYLYRTDTHEEYLEYP